MKSFKHLPIQYRKSLEIIVDQLQGLYGFESIILIGSASRSNEFNSKFSDIDLCIYLKDFDKIVKDKKFKKTILGHFNNPVCDMEPRYISDFMGDRIEMRLFFLGVYFDLTWLPTRLPVLGKSFYDITLDMYELHIGSIFESGILLCSRGPFFQNTRSVVIPFFNEKLRLYRLSTLRKSLKPVLAQFAESISKRDKDVSARFFIVRKLLLQYLCLLKKVYPTSYIRNIDNLLDKLNLPEDYSNNILLLESCSFFDSFSALLEIVYRQHPELK